MSNYGMPASFNGEYFASRTEAMWASYFTSAGIVYEHEPQTFGLKCGIYTPDFHLPDHGLYIEVKNGPIQMIEVQKAVELARGIGSGVLILNGAPRNVSVHCFAPTSKKLFQAPRMLEGFEGANADFSYYANKHFKRDSENNKLVFLIRKHMESAESGWSTDVSIEMLKAYEEKKTRLHQNITWLP